jgi:hypothetical protein
MRTERHGSLIPKLILTPGSKALSEASFSEDSRAAERDIVNVTAECSAICFCE